VAGVVVTPGRIPAWACATAVDLPVSNRRYAAMGVRVGLPALAAALLVRLALAAWG
jgi:hypothetical protein